MFDYQYSYRRKMQKSVIPSFIQKTWEILQNQQYAHALRWLPEGTSFEILDQNVFSAQILPHYFKHSNFSSFVRQLNMYNFHKRKTNTGAIEFHHKLFRRNLRQLLIGIRRKPSEAEIIFGDQLLRRFAPECINENLNFEPKIDETPAAQIKAPQFPVLEQPSFGKLCLLSWMQNKDSFEGITLQKKIKQNIILKNPPNQDIQNRGY